MHLPGVKIHLHQEVFFFKSFFGAFLLFQGLLALGVS
jgi:hypothetical protein